MFDNMIMRQIRSLSIFVLAALPLSHAVATQINYEIPLFDFQDYDVGSQWDWVPDTSIIKDCRLGAYTNKCLRVAYHPTKRGSARLTRKVWLPAHDHYVLTYDLYFEPDFEFVRGGKLPGLAPSEPTSGCQPETLKGWSYRLMWLSSERLRNYIYTQDREAACGDGEINYNSILETGKWYNVELNLKLNSEDRPFGGHAIFKLNGEVIADDRDVQFRGEYTKDSLIQMMMFSTFFGGGDPSWAPSKTVYARFDNFKVVAVGDVSDEVKARGMAIQGFPAPTSLEMIPPPEPVVPQIPVPVEPVEKLVESTQPPETLVPVPTDPVEEPTPEPVAPIQTQLKYLYEEDFDDFTAGLVDGNTFSIFTNNTQWIRGADESRLRLQEEISRSQLALEVFHPGNIYDSVETGVEWEFQINPSEALFVSYWVFFDENFDFSYGGSLPGLSHKSTMLEQNWVMNLAWDSRGRLELEAHNDRRSKSSRLRFKNNRGEITPGQWHFIEMFVRPNTINQKDGLVEVFVDGVKVGEEDRLDFTRNKTQPGLITHGHFVNQMYGRKHRVTHEQDQSVYFDQIKITNMPLSPVNF